MNKDPLSLITGMEKKTVRNFLEKAAHDRIRHGMSTIGPISIQDFYELDIMRVAEVLRQCILTRVTGWAVTKVKLEYTREGANGPDAPTVPVLHKYAYLPGVVENVREIIGNLQKGVFRLPDHETSLTLSSNIKGDILEGANYRDLLLADFLEDENEASMLITPDQKVLTFQDIGFLLVFELTIEKGVGYRKAQDIRRSDEARPEKAGTLTLYLDANFNPVKKVGYKIEDNTLFFNIETNGAVSPFEAYAFGFVAFKAEIVRFREAE